jgi:Predicted membrane protein (DUF2306)
MSTSRLAATIGLGLVLCTSLAIGLYAFLFQAGLSGSPEFQARFDTKPVFAAMHVLGSGMALLIGPFQFMTRIRSRLPILHRWLGRTYVVLILVGGVGGIGLAVMAHGGLVARVGFMMLDVLWIVSIVFAYRAIRARHIATHQQWMLRNFALTFGAVTLRVWLGVGAAFGIPFDEMYPVTAWLAWVPNLILVEWYLARKADRAREIATAR